MTPKSFTIFAVVTAATVVGAVAAVSLQPQPILIPTNRALVFPDVEPNLNKISAVTVTTSSRKITIKRSDKGWVVPELDGYPVPFEKVKTALVDLSKLRFLEAKTSDPARYARLEVEELKAKDAKSKRVEVRNTDGKVIAAAIIGKRNDSLFGADRGGTYVRNDGDPRVWLAEGIVRLGTKPVDWVARGVVDLDSKDVKSVDIREPDGKEFSIRREKKTTEDFKLGIIPKGKAQRGQWETNQMPKALEKLNFDDIKLARELKFSGGPYITVFTTFDGFKIRSEAAKLGKEYWARFSVSADGAKGPDLEKTKKRAAAMNARVSGYVYKISESAGKRLVCTLVNLLEGAGIKACA
jgi:hypothetical protein